MIAKVTRITEFRRMVLKNNWREDWITACLLLITIGLLCSRAMVSIFSVAIIVPWLVGLKSIALKKGLLFAITLVLFPVIFSGYWSEDKNTWWNGLAVKLPLYTMMMGCSAALLPTKNRLIVCLGFLILVSIGCTWSLWQYIADPAAIEAAYLKAKVLPTPADNDHIRFSWMAVIAVLLGISCQEWLRTWQRVVSIGLMLFLVAYLHLLAARTGLICLYTAAATCCLYQFVIHKKWKTGLLIILAALIAAFTAWQTMPTLRNRVQYVLYDLQINNNQDPSPGYNDGARMLSLRAGYELAVEHPSTGVGFGDLRAAINDWHEQHHPQSLAYERFLPANEWIVYAAASGWPGMICFTAGIFLLLYKSTRRNMVSLALSVSALIPFIADDSLEGQSGVILLAFIVFFGQQEPETGTADA
jgi:O-antigen ligase